jgi:hypothetical protein
MPGEDVLGEDGDVDRAFILGENAAQLLVKGFLIARAEQTLETQLADPSRLVLFEDAMSDRPSQ